MSDKLIKTAICLVLFTSLFACSSLSSAPTPSAAEIEKEEQAIYAFFLPDSGGPVLILEGTSSGVPSDDPSQSMDYIRSGLKDLSDQTADNFLERNAQPSQLSANMDLDVEYTLLTSEELQRIASGPNWGELLTEEYPGSYGYTIFSRVGFNNSMDQALIYVGNVGGPLMGSGSCFLMEKQGDEWIVKEQVEVWIS